MYVTAAECPMRTFTNKITQDNGVTTQVPFSAPCVSSLRASLHLASTRFRYARFHVSTRGVPQVDVSESTGPQLHRGRAPDGGQAGTRTGLAQR